MPEYAIIYHHENLCITGVLGTLEQPLKGLEKTCRELGLEYSPPLNLPNREFMAAFNISPPIEFTLARYRNKEASIMTFSLEQDKTLALIDRFCERTGFSQIPISADFKNIVTAETPVLEAANYLLYMVFAQKLAVSMEKSFGFVRYSSFLSKYTGMSIPKSYNKAARTFGIALPIKPL